MGLQESYRCARVCQAGLYEDARKAKPDSLSSTTGRPINQRLRVSEWQMKAGKNMAASGELFYPLVHTSIAALN
jgi:hypothetical protein